MKSTIVLEIIRQKNRPVNEEVAVNNVGSGNIAGTDENPPVKKKQRKKFYAFTKRNMGT